LYIPISLSFGTRPSSRVLLWQCILKNVYVFILRWK